VYSFVKPKLLPLSLDSFPRRALLFGIAHSDRTYKKPTLFDDRILDWFTEILPTTAKLASIYQKRKIMQEQRIFYAAEKAEGDLFLKFCLQRGENH